MEEVFEAILDLNGDKTSSPNRSPTALWQFSWDFVKEEFMGFSLNFMSKEGLSEVSTPCFWC